jgi:hypothetical protein
MTLIAGLREPAATPAPAPLAAPAAADPEPAIPV